jgi:hypothetical protein
VLHLVRIGRHRKESEVQVEVCRRSGQFRNLVHVDVERTRRCRVELNFASGFLLGLAQRSGHQGPPVHLFGVASGLKPTTQSGMVNQADALSRQIGDHCAPGEVSGRLKAGERISQRLGELPHPQQVLRFLLVARLNGRQRSKQSWTRRFQSDSLLRWHSVVGYASHTTTERQVAAANIDAG